MFDLSKLGDMSKLASQAKKLQEKQESFQEESLGMLKKISGQLDYLVELMKKKR